MISKNKTARRNIGLKLKAMREERQWSQTEMGKHLGVNASVYHKYENGVHLPSVPTLQCLWDTFDISMNWLFFDDGPKHRKDNRKKEMELAQRVEELKRKLEEEQKKRQKLEEERDAGIVTQPEVKELLECMERVPLLYYGIMLHFHTFKADRGELLHPPRRD